MFVVALIGFIDAAYLTIEHYRGSAVLCSLVEGCHAVLSSAYATIFWGIPTALLGVLFYLGMLVVIFWTWQSTMAKWLLLYCWVTIPALLWTGWMVYLQLFVLDAICQYCMVSAATSTILFIFAMVLLRANQRT